MKRLFFSMVMLFAASITFAQVKSVKEAKSIAGASNPDFKKAEQLINAAMADPTTQNDPETWNVAGIVQQKRVTKEMEKAYLRKPYDTMQIFNSALAMCEYFLKCDELAQIPDAKGKIKNKYRKANKGAILGERNNLINGGIEYWNKMLEAERADQMDKAKEIGKNALVFFTGYVDAMVSPMFAEENFAKTDSVLPQIAYYAGMTASRIGDYDAVLKYAPYALNDKEVGHYAMEFMTIAYAAKGDSVQWMNTLKEGIEKYPSHPYFFGNLVDYYSNNNKYDEAMAYADEMLAKDAKNVFYIYVKGYLYNNMYDKLKAEGKDEEASAAVDKAIESYKQVLEIDPVYAQALSNLAFSYTQKAQDFSAKAESDVTNPKYAEDQATLKGFYEQARPYYEKVRELYPEQKNLWLQGLYRVYYNLNMGPEFEEIEGLMGY